MEWGEDSQEFAAYSAHFQSHSQRTLDPMGVLRWEEKIERRKQANKKGKVGRRKEMGEEGEKSGEKRGGGGGNKAEREEEKKAGGAIPPRLPHSRLPARSRFVPGPFPVDSRFASGPFPTAAPAQPRARPEALTRRDPGSDVTERAARC